MTPIPLLLVEDDESFTSAVSELLGHEGYEVTVARDLAASRAYLESRTPSATIIDLSLPDGNGLDLLEHYNGRLGRTIVITGNASLDAAIKSLRARVDEFLLKPIELKTLKSALDAVVSEAASGREKLEPSAKLETMLIGESPAMQRVKEAIRTVADSDVNVLIQGETGTGKEVVARLIHTLSPRSAKPFIGINCGAIARELLESELFGHEKGSFTGAVRQHQGHFERGSGGTLLLDEITEMSADLQVTLLRVLEEGTFRRVGGDRELETDVRVLAATNREPAAAVAEGALREDLYYRLSVFPITLPPLRQRPGDVALLANKVLTDLNERHGKAKAFGDAALAALEAHTWPGNVREIKNVVQRGFLLSGTVIEVDDLGLEAGVSKSTLQAVDAAAGLPWKDVERRLIEATLEKFRNDKPAAAEALGISLKTLYNRLNTYKDEDEDEA